MLFCQYVLKTKSPKVSLATCALSDLNFLFCILEHHILLLQQLLLFGSISECIPKAPWFMHTLRRISVDGQCIFSSVHTEAWSS